MPYRYVFEATDGKYFACDLYCERCKGTTQGGSQCKRNSCIGAGFCWMHLRSEKNLRIKTSRIADAGKGLFAENPHVGARTVVFKRNQTIIDYNGQVVTDATLTRRYGENWTATYAIKDNDSIDRYEDASCKRGIGSMLNSAPRNSDVNCQFLTRGRQRKRIVVVATKDIRNGDELLARYGDEYRFDEGTTSRTKYVKRSSKKAYRGL